MKTGDYRRFFDNLGITYSKGTNKRILQQAYSNYWKYSKFGQNNIYIRLPPEIKTYISNFVKTSGLRQKVIRLSKTTLESYDGTFHFTQELEKLYQYKKQLGMELTSLKLLRYLTVKEALNHTLITKIRK